MLLKSLFILNFVSGFLKLEGFTFVILSHILLLFLFLFFLHYVTICVVFFFFECRRGKYSIKIFGLSLSFNDF